MPTLSSALLVSNKMINPSKKDVLDFICDLTGPIGPKVFAGFGSEVQERLAEDPFCFEELVETWLSTVNLVELESILLEIARDIDIPDSYRAERTKFEKKWNDMISELFYTAFSADEIRFRYILSELDNSKISQVIASTLRIWKEEDCEAG